MCEHCDLYLVEGDTPGQQLDEISGSHDGVRVKRFLSGGNRDASLYQVQRGFDVLRRTKIHVTQDGNTTRYLIRNNQKLNMFGFEC